jgi:hypothetical protein
LVLRDNGNDKFLGGVAKILFTFKYVGLVLEGVRSFLAEYAIYITHTASSWEIEIPTVVLLMIHVR